VGDRVVNEFIALFVFLKRAVQTGEREKGREGEKDVAVRKEKDTDLCRHLTVQV
jgi:hypothetical protein